MDVFCRFPLGGSPSVDYSRRVLATVWWHSGPASDVLPGWRKQGTDQRSFTTFWSAHALHRARTGRKSYSERYRWKEVVKYSNLKGTEVREGSTVIVLDLCGGKSMVTRAFNLFRLSCIYGGRLPGIRHCIFLSFPTFHFISPIVIQLHCGLMVHTRWAVLAETRMRVLHIRPQSFEGRCGQSYDIRRSFLEKSQFCPNGIKRAFCGEVLSFSPLFKTYKCQVSHLGSILVTEEQ